MTPSAIIVPSDRKLASAAAASPASIAHLRSTLSPQILPCAQLSGIMNMIPGPMRPPEPSPRRETELPSFRPPSESPMPRPREWDMPNRPDELPIPKRKEGPAFPWMEPPEKDEEKKEEDTDKDKDDEGERVKKKKRTSRPIPLKKEEEEEERNPMPLPELPDEDEEGEKEEEDSPEPSTDTGPAGFPMPGTDRPLSKPSRQDDGGDPPPLFPG
eukprot:CAMPEP_0184488324 /NCGR_PEP_ID=MMETSP0113_2-20130426/11265_1 /TAXON_ID=91329 /ORGANISM="Norrisiella sphaerica, Strain BC52" /LENGTH=213 /DNA_ID=CAMNT_0026870961 /DNA_START=73 /DNA_END=717 /DNA_ORIENTATION=+